MKRVYRGLKRFGHEALRNHVLDVAQRGRRRHARLDTRSALDALLADREVVRYPVRIAFDAARLDAGLFAEVCTEDAGEAICRTLVVHPHFENRGFDLACLVAYHIPAVNYGRMASSADAEAFGATLLGLDVETYYQRVCALADELS